MKLELKLHKYHLYKIHKKQKENTKGDFYQGGGKPVLDHSLGTGLKLFLFSCESDLFCNQRHMPNEEPENIPKFKYELNL